jgi:hypothetical protein
MGFHDRWIEMMLGCISFVSYSILLNGEPRGFINPTRGLRKKGDPLSPYLFILCAEDLHALIQHATMSETIRGVSICRNGPKVSHLLFCRRCQKILSILTVYEEASGQKVNQDKTCLVFSSNTPQDVQGDLKHTLQVPVSNQHENYLGFPFLIGRDKKHSFSKIREHVWSKLQWWK